MGDPVPHGPDTSWAHWLRNAPDPAYYVALQRGEEKTPAKGIVASMLRAIIKHKSERDANPAASFVRLRPTLDTAYLAPNELCAALDDRLGDTYYHIKEMTTGHTARAWQAHPIASEADIETRYVCTYLPCLSSLAETSPFANLEADSLYLARQKAVPYRHYDNSQHIAYADAVSCGARGVFYGAPHEFKSDARLTAAHFDALDRVGELTVFGRQESAVSPEQSTAGDVFADAPREGLVTDTSTSPGSMPRVQTTMQSRDVATDSVAADIEVQPVDTATATPPTDILAQPHKRDRGHIKFYVAAALGDIGDEVDKTLAGGLAKLVEALSYAWAGPTLYASIGNSGRWVATQNAYDREPVVMWAKSLGAAKGTGEGDGDKAEKQETDETDDDDEDDDDPITLSSITYLTGDIPPTAASLFAFAAAKCFTHLAGTETPIWPAALAGVESTPRKDRCDTFGLRDRGA